MTTSNYVFISVYVCAASLFWDIHLVCGIYVCYAGQEIKKKNWTVNKFVPVERQDYAISCCLL